MHPTSDCVVFYFAKAFINCPCIRVISNLARWKCLGLRKDIANTYQYVNTNVITPLNQFTPSPIDFRSYNGILFWQFIQVFCYDVFCVYCIPVLAWVCPLLCACMCVHVRAIALIHGYAVCMVRCFACSVSREADLYFLFAITSSQSLI